MSTRGGGAFGFERGPVLLYPSVNSHVQEVVS